MDKINEIKISIIIPVFNIGNLLDDMLNSVVNQTHSNLEIILVDDGSTDESGALCDAWANKDPRIKCIHQQNAGVCVARNVGFSNSSGEYILFLDGDDETDLEMCEKLLNNLLKNQTDLSYCGFLNIFSNRVSTVSPKKEILCGDEIIDALVNDVSFFKAIWNKLFKRSVLLDANGDFIEFPKGIYVGEDALWLARVLKNAKKASSCQYPLYFWKRREDSATQGKAEVRTDEKYLSVLRAYREMMKEIENTNIRRTMCRKYLGLSRDCMVKAYQENKCDTSTALLRGIKSDLSMYDKKDMFIMKLLICCMLVKIKAPKVLVDRIQKI